MMGRTGGRSASLAVLLLAGLLIVGSACGSQAVPAIPAPAAAEQADDSVVDTLPDSLDSLHLGTNRLRYGVVRRVLECPMPVDPGRHRALAIPTVPFRWRTVVPMPTVPPACINPLFRPDSTRVVHYRPRIR